MGQGKNIFYSLPHSGCSRKISGGGIAINRYYIQKRVYASMTSLELVYQLLGRAVSSLEQALLFFDVQEYEQANRHLILAQDIFAELLASIRGNALEARRTRYLLAVFNDQLLYANINLDRKKLAEVLQMAGRLRTVYGYQLSRAANHR